jgi:hypothetical protein
MNAWRAIGWWELRRLPFNIIVGITGFFAGLLCVATNIAVSSILGDDFGLPGSPLLVVFAVIIYGIMANICYTGGWIVELVVRKIRPAVADRFATSSFYFGLCFSVFLTLSPGILVVAAGLIGFVRYFAGAPHA